MKWDRAVWSGGRICRPWPATVFLRGATREERERKRCRQGRKKEATRCFCIGCPTGFPFVLKFLRLPLPPPTASFLPLALLPAPREQQRKWSVLTATAGNTAAFSPLPSLRKGTRGVRGTCKIVSLCRVTTRARERHFVPWPGCSQLSLQLSLGSANSRDFRISISTYSYAPPRDFVVGPRGVLDGWR